MLHKYIVIDALHSVFQDEKHKTVMFLMQYYRQKHAYGMYVQYNLSSIFLHNTYTGKYLHTHR